MNVRQGYDCGKSEKTSLSEVSHQVFGSKCPGRNLVAGIDPIDQSPKQWCLDSDEVSNFVGKTLSEDITVLNRSEHGAQEKHQSVRVLMMSPDTVVHQFKGVSADLLHRTFSLESEPVPSINGEMDIGLADLIQRKMFIEQSDEWADRTGSVVILGFAE